MKAIKISLFCILNVFLLGSCEMDNIECVRVDGPIETQKRTLSDFNSIFFGDVGNLHISQGNEYSFVMQGQKVVLDKLKTSVSNEELIIRLEDCFNGDAYSLDIFITAPEISKVQMSGVGDVISETPLSSEIFTFIMSGVSEISTLEIEADSISTLFLGEGTILLSGIARTHTILVSGVGDIDAHALSTNVTSINSKGVGDVYVNASEKLDAILNNVGNVYYKGNPEITKEENNVGRVIDAN